MVPLLRPLNEHCFIVRVPGAVGEPSAHDRTSMMMNQQPLIPDPLKEIRG
jgi:hypothetical protein